MYPAKKSNAITKDEAIKIAGKQKVDEVLSLNCEFTSRVIDDCFGVEEMSASVEFIDSDGDDRTLIVLYLVSKDELADCDGDLGKCNYDDYSFEII